MYRKILCAFIIAIIYLTSHDIYSQNSINFEQMYQNAEKNFSEKNYDKSLEIFMQITNNKQSSFALKNKAQCRIGIILSLQQKYELALSYFENVSTEELTDDMKIVCPYTKLQLYAAKKRYTDATKLVYDLLKNPIPLNYAIRIQGIGWILSREQNDEKMRLDMQTLLTDSFKKLGITEIEIRVFNKKITLNELNETNKVNTKNQKNSLENTKDINIIADIESWKKMLENYQMKIAQEKPKSLRIGIILPKNSSYLPIYHRMLRSINAFLESPLSQEWDISFHIANPNNELGSIEQQILELIHKNAIHAFLNPLPILQTQALLKIAKDFEIPVFTVSPIAYIKELQTSLHIQLGMFAEAQCATFLQHIKKQGIQKLGILYPLENYATNMIEQCQPLFQKEQLEIHKEAYMPHITNFQEPVQKLLNRITPEALWIPDSLANAKLIALTLARLNFPKILIIGEKQWAEEIDDKPSIADPFLQNALVPIPEAGQWLTFLQQQTQKNPLKLEIERNTLDALILLRTALLYNKGKYGLEIIKTLQLPSFQTNGTRPLFNLNTTNTPYTSFTLARFQKGKLIFTN